MIEKYTNKANICRFKIITINNFLMYGILFMVLKNSCSLSKILYYDEKIDNALIVLSLSCFFIHIFIKKYNWHSLFISVMLFLLVAYSSIKINNYYLLMTIVTCLALKDEKIEIVIRYIFNLELTFLLLHTFYSLLYYLIYNDELFSIYYGVVRFEFGLGHPNNFSIYLFNILLMWIFLNFENLTYCKILIISLISILSYLFTKTRTNLILIFISFLLFYVIKLIKKDNFLVIVAKFIVPFLCLLMTLLVVLYNKDLSVLNNIDGLLSARIKLGAYAYTNYGFSFLGKKINYKIEYDSFWKLNIFTFDNLYSYILVELGIIWGGVLSWFFYKLVISKRDSKIYFTVIIWALYAFTETSAINGYYCFGIFLISESIWNKNLILRRC